MEPTTGNVPDNPYRLLTVQNLHSICNMKAQNRKFKLILRPKKEIKIIQMNLWFAYF